MNPLLSEILSGAWLISKERSSGYAAILFSMLKGESFSIEDSSIAREKNRSFIIRNFSTEDNGNDQQRFAFSDASIPEGSIAIIPIRSEILKYDQPCGFRGTQSIIAEVKAADLNPNIKSILLVIDSPGGQVTGTDLLADAIKASATPVIAYVEGMAASAAYWIISGATKIIASSELDRIGAIGTMLMIEDLKPSLEAQGVKYHEVYATLSVDKNKDVNEVLDGKYDNFRKDVLDVINQKLLTTVKANRPGLDESVLTGELYFAPQAVSLGLIDEIGSMEYSISVADAIVPEPATLVNPFENISQKSHTMKFNAAWKAIAGFFKMNESDIESQELTFDQVQQINDRLDVLTLKNVELEQSVSTAESALSAEQSAHAVTKESLRVISEQDAGTETGAVKEIDHIEGDGPEPVYAHDKIADQYCG